MAMARSRRTFTPKFDLTLGDRPLAEAREDVTIGRWQGLPALLAATWGQWDLRTHRMRLLAQSVAGTSTVEEWHAAQPDNPDVLVLRAETEVMRAFNLAVSAGGTGGVDRHRLDQAVQTCRRAARAVPEDPVPWVSLLTVARLFPGGHPQTDQWWYELQLRDRYNREAHHQVLRHISARWHGSHTAMYDFARDVASSTPPGSPLAVLLQLARVEEYRHRAGRTADQVEARSGGEWRSETAQTDTRRAFGLWIEQWDGVDRAQDIADLHYLLHAACFGGLGVVATHLFKLVGDRATQAPWCYFGDPAALLDQWYERIVD
jgi:hypothetical protein